MSKIVRASLGKPSNDLMTSLKRRSVEATRQFEGFRHSYEKFLVISFFEGQPFGVLGKVGS